MADLTINGVEVTLQSWRPAPEPLYVTERRFNRQMSTATRSQSTTHREAWQGLTSRLSKADALVLLGFGKQPGYHQIGGDLIGSTLQCVLRTRIRSVGATGTEYVVELDIRERLTASGGGTIADPDPPQGTQLVWLRDVNGRWYVSETGTPDGYAQADVNGRIYIDDTASSGLVTKLVNGRVVVEA